MQQRKLGANGPMVSAIGLGAMSFGGIFGPTDEAESLACLDAMLEAGITFIDTANIYGMGISETIVGKWLSSRRPDVTIATKASFVAGPPRRIDNSEAHLRAELEASLRRLNRDHVELVLHPPPRTRPPPGRGDRHPVAPDRRGQDRRLRPVRNRARHPARGACDPPLHCRPERIFAVDAPARTGADPGLHTAWAWPSSRSRPWRAACWAIRPWPNPTDGFRGQNPRFTEPYFSQNTQKINAFRAFCASRGWSTPATALAWILSRGPHLIPIPGTRKAANLRQWAQAADDHPDARGSRRNRPHPAARLCQRRPLWRPSAPGDRTLLLGMSQTFCGILGRNPKKAAHAPCPTRNQRGRRHCCGTLPRPRITNGAATGTTMGRRPQPAVQPPAAVPRQGAAPAFPPQIGKDRDKKKKQKNWHATTMA